MDWSYYCRLLTDEEGFFRANAKWPEADWILYEIGLLQKAVTPTAIFAIKDDAFVLLVAWLIENLMMGQLIHHDNFI